MGTESFSVNIGNGVSVWGTVCFSVNNGNSVSVWRTECFSVNNGNSVFQSEQWEPSVSVVTHMNAFPSSKTLLL